MSNFRSSAGRNLSMSNTETEKSIRPSSSSSSQKEEDQNQHRDLPWYSTLIRFIIFTATPTVSFIFIAHEQLSSLLLSDPTLYYYHSFLYNYLIFVVFVSPCLSFLSTTAILSFFVDDFSTLTANKKKELMILFFHHAVTAVLLVTMNLMMVGKPKMILVLVVVGYFLAPVYARVCPHREGEGRRSWVVVPRTFVLFHLLFVGVEVLLAVDRAWDRWTSDHEIFAMLLMTVIVLLGLILCVSGCVEFESWQQGSEVVDDGQNLV